MHKPSFFRSSTRVTAAVTAAFALLLPAAGCFDEDPKPPTDTAPGEPSPEPDPPATPAPADEGCSDAVIECDDDSTGAELEVRSFIPTKLPGANPPEGPWKEPWSDGGLVPLPLEQWLPFVCEFYGSGRDFTTAAGASSKLHNRVSVPALPIDECTTVGGSNHEPHCDPSERRCPEKDGSWRMDKKNSKAEVSINKSECIDDRRYQTDQQANAPYPFPPYIPDFMPDHLAVKGHALSPAPPIYNRVKAESWTAIDEDDPTYKVQHYSIDVSHTPFPSHELVATACGQTKLLCTHTAQGTGPSHINLGLHNAEKVKKHVTLRVKTKVKPVLKGTGSFVRLAKTATGMSQLKETVSYYATTTNEGDGGKLTGFATWSVDWVTTVFGLCSIVLKTDPYPAVGKVPITGSWHKNEDGTVSVSLDPIPQQEIGFIGTTSCFYGTMQKQKFEILDCTKSAGTFKDGKSDLSKDLGKDATVSLNQLECHMTFKAEKKSEK
jgi:hypothetical protein